MLSARRTSPRGTFPGGVHPPEWKDLASGSPIEVLPTPGRVDIPLLQHLGAPCSPVVEARSEVSYGEVVGRSEAFVSAPVHASIAGKVLRTAVATLPNDRHVETLPIKSGDEQL